MAKSQNNRNIPMRDILNAAKGQNIDSLMEKLNPTEQAKVRSILSNPEETKKILSSPAVQELIRKFRDNG